MTDTLTILCIDDEPEIRRFLRVSLATQGYEVALAPDGRLGLAAAAAQNPDLIILDLGLPDIDGLEVVRRLREWTEIPIIVLSARGRDHDKIAALDAGADDYLVKPFSVPELLARLRVAMRHAARGEKDETPRSFVFGELTIDLDRRRVQVRGSDVKLTPLEFELLAELARHHGKVLTHKHLLETVWGPAYRGQTHYLRIYMGQLRKKIESDTARPRWLLTEPGVGYRLEDG